MVLTMKCPFCGYLESKVIDSRPAEEGGKIRRRRECLKCSKRFTTYEVVEMLPLMVIKKNGTHEMFNRTKLLNGLLRACEKRPVSLPQLEHMVDEIESQFQNALQREVTSTQIGEMALKRLRDLDQVAYIRFASVYRDFQDIHSFLVELESLREDQ